MRKKVTHIKMKNRIIALGLSFMMIATSLQAFKETSKVARADGEPAVPMFSSETLTLSASATFADTNSDSTVDALTVKSDTVEYKSMKADVDATINLAYDTGSYSSDTLTYTDPGLDGDLSVVDDNITVEYKINYSDDLDWKVCVGTGLNDNYSSFSALSEAGTAVSDKPSSVVLKKDEIAWVYAKPVVSSITLVSAKDASSADVTDYVISDPKQAELLAADTITNYSLQYKISYIADSATVAGTTPTITGTGTVANGYYKGVSIAKVLDAYNADKPDVKNLGTVKYAVANVDSLDASAVAALSWVADPTTISVSTSDTWFVYIGYFDNNGNLLDKNVSTSSVNTDNTAPVISNIGLYSKTSSTDWAPVSGENEYVLDFANKTYQYQFTIEDVDGCGVSASDIKIASDAESTSLVSKTVSGVSGNVYSCNIDAADVSAGDVLQWYVFAEDALGNKSDVQPLSVSVKKPDMTMADPIVSFQYEGESTPIVSLPAYINKTLYINVSVLSGYDIKTITLKTVDAETSVETILYTADKASADETLKLVNEDVTVNGDVNRKKATFSFKVPVGTDSTEILKNMKLDVVDESSASKTDILVGNTWYDSTKPIVSYTTAFDSEWHQSYNLGYEITSGGAASDDTALSEVKVLVDPSSGTVAGSEVTNDVIVPADTLKLENQQITVPTSTNIGGTKVTIKAKDLAGNELDTDNVRYVKVDGENPSIDVSAMDLGGVSFTAEGKLQGNVILDGKPVLKINAKDNLTLKTVTVAVKYPGEDSVRTYTLDAAAEAVELNKNLDFVIKNPDTTGQALDGDYSVTMIATDKAGNSSPLRTVKFRLDNTNPVVSASIYDGTKGGKYPREDGTDEYYKSDVVVKLTAVDDNMDSITVLDNGSELTPFWKDGIAYVTIKNEGYHTVTIDAIDKAGLSAVRKSVGFRIDKTAPYINLSLNGLTYVESRGRVNLMSGADVSISVSDDNEDEEAFMYQVIRQTPDVDDVGEYVVTTGRVLNFTEEGDYIINCATVDKAGNESDIRSMQFRIDRTAPSLQILGGVGGISTSDSVITLVMRETFWKDATGTATIYRKANDSTPEVLYKTIDIIPTSQETRIAEHITENGIYRVEFEAKDQIGHTTETTQSITIDRNAPVVVLTGVNNYDKTNTAVRYYLEITEDFYTTKVVRLSGTRTDSDGSKHELGFPIIDQRANPTIVDQTFSADGIYDITIDARDAAGNKYANTVHFTIDQTAPEIGDISKYDKKNFKEFVWDLDLDELVSDLTVCDVHMYLNGVEYDGESEIDDGAYTLLITAEDELGNKSEAQANFVLDTKAPVFIVDGVEEDEIKNSPYSITVSLQLEEDTLVSVQLNGEEVEIKANTAHVNVTDPGEYSLKMVAVDEAGNQAMKTYFFAYGEEKAEKSFPIIAVVGGVLGLLAIGGIFVAIKKRK